LGKIQTDRFAIFNFWLKLQIRRFPEKTLKFVFFVSVKPYKNKQTQKRAPNSLASAIEDMVVPQKKFANGKRNDSTKSFKPMKKPFKKTKDDVAARSEAMALQLEDVPDFPRGLFFPLIISIVIQ